MIEVVLAVVLGVVVVLAVANWWSRWREDERLELVTKPAVTIAVIGLASVAGAWSDEPAWVAVLTVAALVLCLVGDVALLPAVDRFVVGLGAFLLGHVLFVVAFIVRGLDAPWLGAVAAVVLVLHVAVVGRRIVGGARGREPALVGPVVAYLVIIGSMFVVGWATGVTVVILGATAFVVSDSILGWRRFVGERRWMDVAIMVTYHLAITSLALAA